MKRSRKLFAVGVGLNLVWATACNRDFPELNPKELDFSNARPQDSINSSMWTSYLQGRALLEAWTPSMGSPWTPFVKPTLFSSLDAIGERAKPVYAKEEQDSETPARNFARFNKFDKNTAIFLDLLGNQSVVWATTLAKTHGFQPVATFNNWPHQKGVLRAERVLGGLIYFAAEMAKLKQEGKIEISAPPVFMMDYYRLSPSSQPDPNEFDNRYYLVESDLPSATLLKTEGINQVLYVVPFNTIDKEQDDLNNYFAKLQQNGIKFAIVSAQGYLDENQILTEKKKRESESRSAAHRGGGMGAGWFLFYHGGRGYAPTARQTIFSNPSSGAAGERFVKASGGGFGGYRGISSGSGSGGGS